MNFFSLFKRQIIYYLKKKINIDLQKLSSKRIDYLFKHYGTDKSTKWHGYSKFYEKHLNQIKNKTISILEIGCHEGSSAAAFAKYFPNSLILCLDINVSRFKYFSKKIQVRGVNASDEKKVKKLFKKDKSDKKFSYDLIIDDGSHKTSDILYTLKNMFNLVKPGGYYIIEDYKLANFFNSFHDIDELKVDYILNKLKKKKYFKSRIINKTFQRNLIKKIDKVFLYSGNFIYGKNTTNTSSDICFIKLKKKFNIKKIK